ncbi:MAG: AAA family ATPase [Polaromonas sp.]|nr:AAA family ATPase [Polaromonas sp.]
MSATKPIFHLLAGPNGAGKSTLYQALVASGSISSHLEFVNADLYEQSHLRHIADLQKRSEAARNWADSRREALLNAKAGFVSETVFSHESKLALIAQAQAMDLDVVLHVVSLDDPRRLLARVRQRVREGGHNVPAARILERYPRTMANLKKAVRMADLAFIYDAAEVEQGAQVLVAVCEKGKTTALVEAMPDWAMEMLPGA